jgi:hypothetical protein
MSSKKADAGRGTLVTVFQHPNGDNYCDWQGKTGCCFPRTMCAAAASVFLMQQSNDGRKRAWVVWLAAFLILFPATRRLAAAGPADRAYARAASDRMDQFV